MIYQIFASNLQSVTNKKILVLKSENTFKVLKNEKNIIHFQILTKTVLIF